MRKGTKILVTFSVFSVAMNLNACAYGPPPEGFDYRPPTATPVIEQQVETQIPVDPANWYRVTQGRYAVIRMLSLPGEDVLTENQAENVTCGIEVLFAYNVEEELNSISELLIPAKDISLFSEGDVLLVSLGKPVHSDGKNIYRIEEGESGVIFAPYVENQLGLVRNFTGTAFYESLINYNFEIKNYQRYLENDAEFYMEFDFRPLEEGMTTEETALFFEDLKKAKEAYEVYLDELRNQSVKGAGTE